jgi:glycosyltransferase involved in cell wall biosynthesis
MPTVALSMIVRDEESSLPACLESVKDLVDEILIADTGSKDGTLKVARRYGARCVSIPWEDDFARARNRALEEVRTDWVLYIDADEQLDEKAKLALPRLLKSSAADGYFVPEFDYVWSLNVKVWDFPTKPNQTGFAPAKRFPGYVEHAAVRLFRRRPGIYFVGRVHESVHPRILQTGGVMRKADFPIHHIGFACDGEIRIRKNLFYFQLLQKKVQETPSDAQAHLQLGLSYFDNYRNFEAALNCFVEACRLHPRFGTAWLYQGLTLRTLGHPAESLQALQRAKSLCGHSADLAEGEGDAYYDLQDYDAARRSYKRALTYRNRWPAIESKLGLAEVRLGRTRAGLERLSRAVQEEPLNGDIHDRLIQACVWLDLLEEAAHAADHKLSVAPPDPQSFLRAASIHARLEQRETAAQILRAGLCLFPHVERLQRCFLELAGPPSKSAI